MSVVDEIKERIDIVELVSDYVPGLKKSGRSFRALCPFHSEKTPSFFVFPERGSWRCFGACATGGDIFSFIMKKENVDFGEALRILADRAGVPLAPREEKEFERLYEANEAARNFYHNLLLASPDAEFARNYLEGRGISRKTIEEFQLGFSLPDWDSLRKYLGGRGYHEDEMMMAGLLAQKEVGSGYDLFRGRLMFPINDAHGRTCGFGARALDEVTPKYLNSPKTEIFDKSAILYGLDRARVAIRREKLAIIVEGYMDVLTAHQHGVTNVVASMGTSLGERQASAIKHYAKDIVMALDADVAGREATLRELDSVWHATQRRSGKYVAQEADVRVIGMPPGKDPDELIREDPEGWKRMVDEALPWADFVFNAVTSNLDPRDPRDKSAVVERLGPYIQAMPDPILRAHYIQRIAGLIRVDERTVDSAIRRPRPKGTGREQADATPPTTGDPLEEHCLSLFLQHPELRGLGGGLSQDYFERIENREVFSAWQRYPDIDGIHQALNQSLHEHLDSLIYKELPPASERETGVALSDCIRRLRERMLRGLIKEQGELLFSGCSVEEPSQFEEQLIEVSKELKEIFSEEKRGWQGRTRG